MLADLGIARHLHRLEATMLDEGSGHLKRWSSMAVALAISFCFLALVFISAGSRCHAAIDWNAVVTNGSRLIALFLPVVVFFLAMMAWLFLGGSRANCFCEARRRDCRCRYAAVFRNTVRLLVWLPCSSAGS